MNSCDFDVYENTCINATAYAQLCHLEIYTLFDDCHIILLDTNIYLIYSYVPGFLFHINIHCINCFLNKQKGGLRG